MDLGVWIAAFLTICIFSFLFKDNPFYRFAEHFFIGVTAGYYVAFYSLTILKPKLFDRLFSGELILLVTLTLGLMTFGKLTKRYKWTSRWPIAFVVGCTVGLAIVSKLQANVVDQCTASVKPFRGKYEICYDAMDSYTKSLNSEKKSSKGLSLKDVENFWANCIKVPVPKDRNGDNKISLIEWSKFNGLTAKMFAMLDKNRDAVLTPRELTMYKKRYPMKYPAHFNSAWDTNGDGCYSLIEVQRYGGMPPAIFTVLDTNKDKFLDKKEMKVFKKKVRIDFPIDKKKFFDEADANKDGFITKAEWKNPSLFTAKVINGLVSLVGVICCLCYFFFSKEQKGVMGGASKMGIYFLMVCFGASFGYTVMARISLLIGRMRFLIEDWIMKMF